MKVGINKLDGVIGDMELVKKQTGLLRDDVQQ